MYDPTNAQDELNRKVLNTIYALLQKRGKNQISDGAFALAVKSVWECTSGLVGDQIQDTVDSVLNESQKVVCDLAFVRKDGCFFMLKAEMVDIATVKFHAISVKNTVNGFVSTTNEQCMEREAFVSMLGSFHNKLAQAGYLEVVGAEL